jgi:hypothetical protein
MAGDRTRWLALAATAVVTACGARSELVAPGDGGAVVVTGDVPTVVDGQVFVSGPLPSCPSAGGVPRDCGLRAVTPVLACAPGRVMLVACNAACGLGRCTGDPVLQVCPATGACVTGMVLGSNDDSTCNGTSSLCSAARFVCPADGRFVVYAGAFSNSNVATCDVAVQ